MLDVASSWLMRQSPQATDQPTMQLPKRTTEPNDTVLIDAQATEPPTKARYRRAQQTSKTTICRWFLANRQQPTPLGVFSPRFQQEESQ